MLKQTDGLLPFVFFIIIFAANVAVTFAQAEGQIKAENVLLSYKVFGKGTPIILLSGGPGTSSDYFAPLAKVLGQTHQAILLDQRGTGKSRLETVDQSTINLDSFVDDLEIVRESFKSDRWILLGHSWGGVLAMAYAAKHPARVQAMILVSSGGINLDYVQYYPANVLSRLTPAERDVAQFWLEPTRFMANPDRALLEYSRVTAPAMVFDRKHSYALVEQTLADGGFNTTVNLIMNQQWMMNPYDFREPLRKFSSPVLIVQGRQDPIGESTAYQIQQHLPNAKLKFIEQCGHWAFVEQEQAFVQLVRDFLKFVE